MKQKMCLKGHYKFTLRDAKTGEIQQVFEYDNIIPTTGRTLLANNLTDNTPTNDPFANYVAVGTGTNVPASTDTQLQTELYRNATASSSNINNIAYITAFFGTAVANGTLKEAGIFCDATGVADSGILLSRVAINITKTAASSLTLDWSLEIT